MTQSQTRARISSNIITYRKRRAELARGELGRIRTEEQLIHHKKKTQQKIDNWNRRIKRMDIVKNKLIALGNAVAYFTGVNIKGIGPDDTTAMYNPAYNSMAIFSKWGLEHHLHGDVLSDYMAKHKDSAGRLRLEFTRSFEEKPERRELYSRFCEYMERLQQENIENNGV